MRKSQERKKKETRVTTKRWLNGATWESRDDAGTVLKVDRGDRQRGSTKGEGGKVESTL